MEKELRWLGVEKKLRWLVWRRSSGGYRSSGG